MRQIKRALAYARASVARASAVAGFFLRTAAEIRVTSNPTGKGSVKVMAAFIRGLANIAFMPSIS